MAITKEHIRFSIHFSFHLKKNAAMICAAYGENAVSLTTCKRQYKKFRQEDFSFEDKSHAGRS